MREDTFSRRTALAGALIGSSLLIPSPTSFNLEDARLLSLGRRFDALAILIDSGIFTASDKDNFDALGEEMLQTPACTLEGLLVKAKVAAWEMMGDVDPFPIEPLSSRMALAIVRDLIKKLAPELYRPGALEEFVSNSSRQT